jgi:hypothetical protein
MWRLGVRGDEVREREGDVHKFIKLYFTGESFRVLEEKEVKQFGEYRTRRPVSEAWDRVEKD